MKLFVAPLVWQPDRRISLARDLLVVRKDRIGEKTITQPPTLVVEVLSPGTARIDRALEFARYAEGGIEQYWLVDPRVPLIEVSTLVDGSYRLMTGGIGDQQVMVAEPIVVTVVPRDLIST